MKDIRHVGIIGTGVAGLVTAKTLVAQGVECQLYEKSDRLGGVWSDGYSNFSVQVPKELYEFPDWPMPEESPDFASGEIFQKYLEDYVDHFNFRSCIRFNTSVIKVEKNVSENTGWRVTIITDAGTEQQDYDLVVVATGLYSNIPNIPSIQGESKFNGQIMHNSQVKSRTLLTGKNIAVVGYGKSAMDIVQEAVGEAKTVHMVFRKPHWPVPRKLAGLVPTKWGALSRTTKALMPLYIRPTPIEQWLDKFGKPLKWIFWRSLEALIRVQFKLGKKISNGKDITPSMSFEVDTCGEGTSMADPDFFPLIHEGRVSLHRTEISHYTPESIVLKDGLELTVDSVVFATGWKCDYRYLSEELCSTLGNDEDGFYLYRYMLHPQLPNLVFVGRVNAFSNIFTYSLQARWLEEYIAGNVSLPEPDAMLREIAEMKNWKRSWMHFSPTRSSRLFLHAQHYHDELLNDFGVNAFRKKGLLAPLKELFSPYMPIDYRDIVSGEFNRTK